MNKLFAVALVCANLFTSTSSFAEKAVKLINPVFYSSEQTAEYLTSGDNYLSSWGEFDVLSRLHNDSATYNDVVDFVKKQARSWDETSTKIVKTSIEKLNKNIEANGFNLPLADKVPFMLSAMGEEGQCAAYTRREGIAISNRSVYRYPNFDILVAHELFHVLTRNNPDFKKKIYKLIGFETLKKDIAVPESFKNKMISNPDVDHHNTYATFKIGGKKVDCAMFIFSKSKWKGGTFFDYLEVGLIEIDKKKCELVLKDGEPIIHSVSEAEDFYDKVGIGTSYIIDPEEILADNFSYVLCNSFNSKLEKSIKKLLTK